MPHRLSPKEGAPYLSPAQVVERLKDEFSFVDPDQEAGADHVRDQLTYFTNLFGPGFVPPQLKAQIKALERGREEATQVHFGDDPRDQYAYLRFVVVPGQPPLIGYSSGQHEDAAQPLLERCASALSYRIEQA